MHCVRTASKGDADIQEYADFVRSRSMGALRPKGMILPSAKCQSIGLGNVSVGMDGWPASCVCLRCLSTLQTASASVASQTAIVDYLLPRCGAVLVHMIVTRC